MNSIVGRIRNGVNALDVYRKTHGALSELAKSQRKEKCKAVWEYMDYCNKARIIYRNTQAPHIYEEFMRCFDIRDGYVELAGIHVPAPTADDIDVWNHEFMDIIVPYVFYGNEKSDYKEIARIFNEGPYETGPNVCIRRGDVVIDCGANLGMFSAVASAKGASVIYAFEPLKSIAEEQLAGTAKRNPNIVVVNKAVSDTMGTGELLIEENIGGSGLKGVSIASGRGAKTAKVDTTTLDDFCSRNGIEKVDFIKSDIEGAERNMLRGARDTLKYLKPRLSICTYHHPEDPKLLEEIVLEANPNYIIKHQYMKLYAYVKESDR